MAISSIGFAQKTLSLDSLITKTEVISLTSQTPTFTYCNLINTVYDTSSFIVPKGYIAKVMIFRGRPFGSWSSLPLGVCINNSFLLNDNIMQNPFSSQQDQQLWIAEGDKITRCTYFTGTKTGGKVYAFWEIKLFKLE